MIFFCAVRLLPEPKAFNVHAGTEELSAKFEVTASTIRRDLALLNSHGLLARTYGGAMAVQKFRDAGVQVEVAAVSE